MLKLGLCVALLLVPLLLLSNPRHIKSRVASSQPRGRALSALVTRQADDLSVPLTPWTTTVVLADDIVQSAVAATTTTLPQVPVIAVRYDPSPTTSTAVVTTTTGPPPQPSTTTTTTAPPRPAHSETGEGSWYPAPAGTCASPDLAFGTVVGVTNLSNGQSTTCRVEDRGPAVQGRIIDLSEQTFSQIADPSTGLIEVRLSW